MTFRHTKAVRLCKCSFCRLLLLLWCNNCLLLFGFLKFQYSSNYKQHKPYASRNKTWQKLNVGGCSHSNGKQSYHKNKYGGNNLPGGVRLLFTLCNQSSAAQRTYQNHNGKNQQQTPQQRQDDGNHRHGNRIADEKAIPNAPATDCCGFSFMILTAIGGKMAME